MNRVIYFALFSCVILCGCDSVLVDTPFGARTTPERLSQIVGQWTDEEHNIFELRLTKSGELISGHLTWDDATEQFISQSHVLDLRTENHSEYLFVKDEDLFGFVRVEAKGNDEILLYVPDPKVFRDRVQSGSLSGTVDVKEDSDQFTVRLAVDEKLKAFLASSDWKQNYLQDSVIRYQRFPAPQ